MSPSQSLISEEQKGLIYALACYLIWGMFPLYWYPVTHSTITAGQLLAQRIMWSAIFSFILLIIFRQVPILLSVFKNYKLLLTFTASAFAISMNWLVYLWAIAHNHVLDASLGYFISPLFSVLLGRIFFSERLNGIQVFAILLAVIGVLWLAIPAGQIPWVALLLTVTLGFYGLLRKLVQLAVLPSIALETLLMLPFAIIYLIWTAHHSHLVFAELPALPLTILIGSGAVTTIPLLLFASGARRISLSNLGIIQYASPTCQFILGLWIFKEAFNLSLFIGYVWVWAGVSVYIFGIWKKKKTRIHQP